MTDTAKATLWVIIILVIIGGTWWYVSSSDNQDQATVETQQIDNTATSTATTTIQAPVEDASTSISVQDKSDSALDTDLNKVDDQIKLIDSNN